MCQDTGTAIVMGKRGQRVLTEGVGRGSRSAGACTTPTPGSTCATRRWPRSRRGTRRTPAPTCPRQIELYADTAAGHETTTSSCSWPRAGGSANKSYLYQETKAVLNPRP
jgi:fumarate hydratase class I